MKKWFLLLCFIVSLPVQAGEVRVATATNFLSTLKNISPLFEEQTGHQLRISSASSGKLYAQIINGAPFDVFLSADRYFPERLVEADKAINESRFIYATGVLILWSSASSHIDEKSLLTADVHRIAIANPKTAPYGLAAKQTMDKMGISRAIKHKIVTGESVGQAFQFTATGNAQLGFVSASQVYSPINQFNREYYWQVPFDYYDPIDQEAALLKRGKNNPAAIAFMEFMKSDAARRMITQSGYR